MDRRNRTRLASLTGALLLACGLLVGLVGGRATATTVDVAGPHASASTGYRLVASDGGVFSYGGAGFDGSMGGTTLNAPVVGTAPTPDGGGYWLVASDGGIFAFGDAGFYGSMGGTALNAPIVGMAPSNDGKGYWLVASDGGIFAFGDAGFYGSMGGTPLDAPVVGMAANPDGNGYWLVGADGGVFSFGFAYIDAPFYGSMGGKALNLPIVGITSSATGEGYWLVASDGGVFSFGDAAFFGSAGSLALNRPIVGMASTPDGHGYWLVASDGGVFAYGDAPFDGSMGGAQLDAPVVGGSPSGATAGSVLAAGLPSFYSTPTQLPSGPPGTLMKSEQIAAPGIDGTVYVVMYVSETELGRPVAVTGLVMVPDTPAPAGGYPVVTWGHGTNGMAPQCAPSLQPSSAVPYQNQLLAQGWEVTASDYQGEGTPGMMPYLAGVSAARNTIDIVRAARQLPAAHASADYVVWGHSEGGQTAMFGLDIADSYAPELHLDGVVAGAPPSQFEAIYAFLDGSPYQFYLFMAGAGFNLAYGNAIAPLPEVVTPQGLSLLPVLGQGCFDELQAQLDQYPLASIVPKDPFTVPAWKLLLEANDPAGFTTPSTAPLLIVQGGADEQIPVVTTQLLEQHECSIGQDVERWIYPGLDHTGVIPVSMDDMITWIGHRFAGDPDPDPYVPTGGTGTPNGPPTTTTCAG
ncbi:MAG: lipase family protein [Acidimicrobiales bacterium]